MPRAAKSAGVKRAVAAKKVAKKAPTRAVAKKAAQPEPKARASAQRRPAKTVAPPKKAAKGSPIKKAVLADQGPKVQRLVDAAKEQGWAASLETPTKAVVIVNLTRADEEIIVTFADGKLDRSHRPIYRIGGQREVLLKGASGVLKQMAGQGKVQKVLPPRKVKRKTDDGQVVRRVKVPFDVNEDDDEIILAAVAGHRIEWWTGLEGLRTVDEARIRPLRYCPKCGREPEHEGDKLCHRSGCGGLVIKEQVSLKMKPQPASHPDPDHRILSFVDAKTGRYRAVYLKSIITVR